MSELIKKFLAQPHAKEILTELVRHIKKNVSPIFFSNIWLEFMRAEENTLRRDAGAVLFFVASRSWEEVRDDLIGAVNEDERDILMTPEAEKFYNKWLTMVSGQVQQYYDDFMKEENE